MPYFQKSFLDLLKIVPELKLAKTGEPYDLAAKEDTAKEFLPLFAKGIRDRYLWVSLHIFVAMIGIVLMVMSILHNKF